MDRVLAQNRTETLAFSGDPDKETDSRIFSHFL